MFIAPSAYPLGGMQTWLDYIVPGLASREWEPVLGLVSGRLHDSEAYLRIHPFDNVHIIASTTGTRQARVRGLMRSIEKVDPGFVVILNIADAYLAAAKLRLNRRLDLKIVGTLNGLQPSWLQDFEYYRDHLDAVVCSSRLAGALVQQCCSLAADRIFYAPVGVRIPESNIRSGDDHDGPLRLAYVGRMENEYKRIYDVVDIVQKALAAGLDFKMAIAGGGTQSDGVMRAISRKGLADRVRYLGILDQHRVREQVYAVTDVLLVTSSSETGPLVAWEAMAEGLALVTSNYLGRRYEGALKDESNCLVFPVGDIDKAVDCLLQMRNVELRNRIADAGRDLVVRRYSRAATIETWSNCLEQICALPSRPKHELQINLEAHGRLDRFLGVDMGESIRRLLGREYIHAEPGGEWPHSYGDRRPDDPEFWRIARQLDARGEVR